MSFNRDILFTFQFNYIIICFHFGRSFQFWNWLPMFFLLNKVFFLCGTMFHLSFHDHIFTTFDIWWYLWSNQFYLCIMKQSKIAQILTCQWGSMHVQIIVDFMSSKKKMTPLLSFRTTAILQKLVIDFFFKKKKLFTTNTRTSKLKNLEMWTVGRDYLLSSL